MAVVRRFFEAWARDDLTGMVDLWELDDFIWDLSHFRGWPGQDEFRGFAGFAEFLSEWLDPYEEWSVDLERVLDAGGPKVAAVLHQQGRMKGGSSWVELRYGIVYMVKGGKMQRADVYATPEEALEAAGLSE